MRIPWDLERDIFELTARCHRGTAMELALVACRCQAWMEPIIYEMVTLDSAFRLRRFMFTLRIRPADFFAKHVKTLLCCHVPASQRRELFSACTGVVNLACWGSLDHTWLSSFKAPEYIRYLSVTLLQPPPAPFFTNVTHLDVVGSALPTVEALSVFPNLTHLALDDHPRYSDTDGTHLVSLLSSSDILKIVVVLVYNPDRAFHEATPIYRRDFRLVLLDQPLDLDALVEAWEGPHVRGGSNMWTRAEAEADKRRRIMTSHDGLH